MRSPLLVALLVAGLASGCRAPVPAGAAHGIAVLSSNSRLKGRLIRRLAGPDLPPEVADFLDEDEGLSREVDRWLSNNRDWSVK